MLTDLGKEWINRVRTQLSDGKSQKVPNRSHRAKKYSNRTEKYTRGFQHEAEGPVNLKTGSGRPNQSSKKKKKTKIKLKKKVTTA